MSKTYHGYLGATDKLQSLNKKGLVSVNDQWTEKTNGDWTNAFGPIVPTLSYLSTLNTALSTYTESTADAAAICNQIRNAGFTVVMTPWYGACAEAMSGTSGLISTNGVFSLDEFDGSSILDRTAGYTQGDANLNNCPYLCYAGFNAGSYFGIFLMAYDDYVGQDITLKDLFAPNQVRSVIGAVLNADGSEVYDTTGTSSTIFSDGQFPGTNGYNNTSRFAQDDGTHGINFGIAALDGNGGPYLSNPGSGSYGCENANGGDTSADDFYWGTGTVSTTYKFYSFVRYA